MEQILMLNSLLHILHYFLHTMYKNRAFKKTFFAPRFFLIHIKKALKHMNKLERFPLKSYLP